VVCSLFLLFDALAASAENNLDFQLVIFRAEADLQRTLAFV
jgi:hypothetical protein